MPTFPVINNPVFVYYRKTIPSYTGDTYSATDTYAVDEQIYFTNALNKGDFYKCLVATSAGQSPSTTAASWEIIPIQSTFSNTPSISLLVTGSFPMARWTRVPQPTSSLRTRWTLSSIRWSVNRANSHQ